MFVTREERQPLGGLVSYWLPAIITGGAWIGLIGLALALITVSSQEVSRVHWIAVGAGAGFAGTLFLTGRAGKWLPALIGALGVAGLMALACLMYSPYPAYAFALITSWLAATGLVGAMVDNGRFAIPPWRLVFLQLVRIPVIILLLVMFCGLLGVMVLAVADLGSVVGRDGLDALVGDGLAGDARTLQLILTGGVVLMTGLLAAVVRRQRVMVGSIRYAMIWLSQFLLPVAEVIAVVMMLNYTLDPQAMDMGVFSTGTALLCAVIALTSVLVYQTGEGRMPGLWLGIAVSLAPLILGWLIWGALTGPMQQLIAVYPASILPIFLEETFLLALYAVFLGVAVVTQPFSGKVWMNVLGPLLTLLTGIAAFYPVSMILFRLVLAQV